MKKLDYVLNITADPRDYFHLNEHLGRDGYLNIDEHNLKLFLNKLKEDGYIDFRAGKRFVEGQEASEGVTIRRNFNGDIFIAQGGYVGQETHGYRKKLQIT